MIKLKSLYLEPYHQIKHMSIVKKLNDDQMIYRYISHHFSMWLNETIISSNIKSVNHYVIYNKSKESIGMCGNSISSSNQIIELWYCIDQEHRNHGFAEKLVVEITHYFLSTLKDLQTIKLVINKDNIYSNKVANKSGYSLVNEDKDKNVYQYFKTKI